MNLARILPETPAQAMSKPSKEVVSTAVVSRWETWLLGCIVLLGLIPRLLLLVASDFGIESDEAIVGLMAKHISEGKHWPIFYYGQHYMGSVEASLAAIAFSVFGISNATLKLVPLLFSLLHIGLVYSLARRFCEARFALLAALFVALAPSTLILWSSKSRGGFIELVALGTLALILTVDLLRERQPSSLRIGALGFLLGIGWWMNNQVAYYIAPIGLVLLFSLPPKLGLSKTLKVFCIGLASFILGGLPFWYANIFLEPQWATFELLFSGTKEVNAWAHFEGLLSQALPILLGARRFWSDTDVFTAASTLAYCIYGGAGLVLLAAMLRDTFLGSSELKSNSETSKERGVGIFFLLLFVCATAFIFSRSSFGWLSRAPRYLLPLYSVLPVLVAVAISRLFLSRNRLGTVLASSMLVAVLALNLSSNYLGGIAKPGQPSVFQGQRVADSHAELYSWLTDRGYTHIGTNYWIGYRTAFETKEQIRFTRIGRPRSLRIPSYESVAPQALVFVPAEAALYERQLRQFGYSFARSKVGDYVVLDSIVREQALGERIPRDRFVARASVRTELVDRMFDGDRESRWGSGAPQAPLMAVEMEFLVSEVVAGLSIDLGRFVHDAPRRLRVEGRAADGEWLEIADFSETKIFFDLREGEFAEIPAVWQLTFEPRKLKGLRLLQLEATSVFDWSLAELSIHAPVNDFKKEEEFR